MQLGYLRTIGTKQRWWWFLYQRKTFPCKVVTRLLVYRASSWIFIQVIVGISAVKLQRYRCTPQPRHYKFLSTANVNRQPAPVPNVYNHSYLYQLQKLCTGFNKYDRLSFMSEKVLFLTWTCFCVTWWDGRETQQAQKKWGKFTKLVFWRGSFVGKGTLTIPTPIWENDTQIGIYKWWVKGWKIRCQSQLHEYSERTLSL
jgi:hypothetical protein